MRRARAAATGVVIMTMLLAGVITSRSALDARQAQFVIPVAASSLALRPDAFIGKTVSMTGAVEAQLSPTVFSVDQDAHASTGNEVLVLSPTLMKPVEPGTYVTAQGDVIRFDRAGIAARLPDYQLDLPDDVIARYEGRAVVIATSVITADLEDIAKVPPPPMSRAEEQFDAAMKRISPAFNELRGAIREEDAGAARERLDVLESGFTDAEAFFVERGNSDDAVDWAREAKRLVGGIELAVNGEYWELATAGATELSQQCSACHGEYRIQLDDGSYRVKFGGGGG